MAQFDVYRGASGRGLLLDCQSELLSELESRVVIPLLPVASAQATPQLNPVFVIEGHAYVLSTHLVFAVPTDRLTATITNLSAERYTILDAIDMLWSGV
jgi:toxin CcdB